MSSENIITLYDVASSSGLSPSFNVWKARYALNFKGIPYKTTWLECPDIAPTLRSIGAAPTGTNANGSPRYTVPTILDPNRLTPSGGPTVVSESLNIVQYLDEAYPGPVLLPPGTKALQALFYNNFNANVIMPFVAALAPYIYLRLNEKSHAYYRQQIASMLGGQIEDICPKGSQKWDDKWLGLQKDLTTIATLLDENGSTADAFIMGKQATFSDLVVAAFLEALFITHPEEWRTKVRTWDNGRWEKLRELCADWRILH